MQFKDAANEMLYQSHKSMRGVSLEIGRAPSFLFTTLQRGSSPQIDTAATIARACGYRLALVPNSEDLPGGAIVLD